MTDIAPPSPRGYVLAAGQGLAPDRPDLKASAGSTGGQLTVFTLVVDGGPPRHTHTREDESIYLFSGLREVECDGEESEAATGSFVFLPRERPHTFRSVGGTAAGCSSSRPAGWRGTSTPCMPRSRPATGPRSERSRPSTASARRDSEGRLGRLSGSEPPRWRQSQDSWPPQAVTGFRFTAPLSATDDAPECGTHRRRRSRKADKRCPSPYHPGLADVVDAPGRLAPAAPARRVSHLSAATITEAARARMRIRSHAPPVMGAVRNSRFMTGR